MTHRACSVLAALAAISLLAVAVPAPALAWGANGHRIVGQIGEDHLSPAARHEIHLLAGRQSLALLSTWPDFIRSFRAWDCVKPWHFLTVEDGETIDDGLAREADLARSACDEALFRSLGMPDNVLEAIDYFAAIVGGDEVKRDHFARLMAQSGVEPYGGSVRLTALSLVVHFVGDIHQPLHVGRGGDRGGNSITVEWFDELTRLHSLWDSGLIEHEGLSYSEFVEFLEQEFAGGDAFGFGEGPRTWAQESIDHRAEVYAIGDPRNPDANLARLSWQYAAERNELLKRRLYAGGVRLAQLLNNVLAPPEAPDEADGAKMGMQDPDN